MKVLRATIKWPGLVATLLLASAAGPILAVGDTAAGAASANTPKYAVGVVMETFVDTHRTTPAWSGSPQLPTRTLVTTILYPATGASK